MTIRISRNAAGNCINFIGSSLPAYFNACLSGEVDANDNTLVSIVNDIQTANNPNGEIRYEFYQIPYTEFADKDGNPFPDAQAAADYVTQEGRVLGVSDVGTDLTGVVVNFRLDQTSTSIIMDNGAAFGVNTIKAVSDADGTIHLHAIGAGVPEDSSEPDDHKHYEKLSHVNVQINGVAVAGGLNDVCNALNELFTVGAFESVVISDPYATLIADVDGTSAGHTLVGNTSVDPIGNDIFGNTGSGNLAGLLSTETIDQAGEYYTFFIRGEGTIGFGLVHTQDSYDDGYFSGNSNYADPASFAVGNSAHYGYQFSHWFHPTPNGSWTNYGASTGFIYGSGWYNWDQQADWLAGNPVKIRCGIDTNGYISIESLQDDGSWAVHARTSYPVAQGSEFRLGIKSSSSPARVYSSPKVHLLEPSAPTMYFRYIESPDGVFHYPLFSTAEEAEYYDEIHNSLTAGTGSSHTHTYADDPTNTNWYMPEASHDPTSYQHSSAPSSETFSGNPVSYTEITSLENSDLSPPAFSATAVTQEEGTAVNIQVAPAGSTWSSSVSISPSGSGLVYDGYSLVQGTLADVGSDTAYTITVVRANSYGSTTGSMTVTATDVAPATTSDTPWTKALDFSGSSERGQMVTSNSYWNPMIMGGTSITCDLPLSAGNTSSHYAARPWATVVVFKSDRHNSNQHIWNMGDGAASGDDNIYLKLDGQGQLQFNWGRVNAGSLNQCRVASGTQSNTWYAVYIASNGSRLSASDATATNLADSFDIRLMSSGDSFGSLSSNLSTSANWTSTGGRMDRSLSGNMTIGGRGANRSFHGKVASFVTTTLQRGAAMPSNAEIEEMIVDPVGWLNDYKIGETYRPAAQTYNNSNFQLNDYDESGATQIWLMGDGNADSYSNMIRNIVFDADQNYTKLNLLSMVSNDIQNVNINGLS
jgi:hypothetical protein